MPVDTDAQRRLLEITPTLYMSLREDELWPLYDAIVKSPDAPKRLLFHLRCLIEAAEGRRSASDNAAD